MPRQTVIVLYVAALVAVVVSVDVLFFRNHLWARLMVNVGIVCGAWRASSATCSSAPL
jgi:hypothetical protein